MRPLMLLWLGAALVIFTAACGGESDGSGATAPTGWGNAQQIGGSDADQGTTGGMLPQLAISTGGTAFVVWQRLTASSPTAGDLVVNRYDPSSGWGVAEAVAWGDRPVIVADAVGSALLVWAEGTDAARSLAWRRFRPGSGWSATSQVPGTAGRVIAFSLAMVPTGAALAVWTSADAVWASRFSPDGGWGSPLRIAQVPTDGEARAPQAVLGSGSAAVVWIDYQALAPFGSWSLRGTRFVPGSGWQPAQGLGSGRLLSTTRLAGNEAGEAAVAWTWMAGVAVPPHYAHLSASDGWQGGTTVDALSAGTTTMQLAMDAQGAAVLVLSPPAAADGTSILTALRADASSSWSEPAALPLGNTGSTVGLDIDADSVGTTLVAWVRSQRDSSSWSTAWTVWAAGLSSMAQWGQPVALRSGQSDGAQCGPDRGAGGAYAPAVRFDASGRAVAVWGEFDCHRWSIWADQFRPQ